MANYVTGKDAAVYVTSSPSVLMASFQATTTSDRYTYSITNQVYRYWDPNATVQVQVNGAAPGVGYKVQHCGGKLIFASQLAPGDVVTVKCNYFPYSKVAGANTATLTLEREMIKDTRLGDSCQRVIPGPKNATISLEQAWTDATFYGMLTSGRLVGIVVHDAGTYNVDSTAGGPRYECYGYVKSDQAKLEASGIMGETVEFESAGEIYYSAI
jgi:hypothetical protein